MTTKEWVIMVLQGGTGYLLAGLSMVCFMVWLNTEIAFYDSWYMFAAGIALLCFSVVMNWLFYSRMLEDIQKKALIKQQVKAVVDEAVKAEA